MADSTASLQFITDYLYSLAERTQVVREQVKFGLDWVVYNLGVELGWVPVRLPFLRRPEEPTPKVKTEAEFGIDIAFIDPERNEYIVFVLKDEELTNQTWIRNAFNDDLAKAPFAALAEMKREEFDGIQAVRVILAYNKDENSAGLNNYDNYVGGTRNTIGDSIPLSFERWNLTILAQKVSERLLKPDLLPQQRLIDRLRYICYQVHDFEYGSAEWDNLLIPLWKRFIDEILTEPVSEARLRLIPVVMSIVRLHFKEAPSSRIGYIDLVEWAMVALWRVYPGITDNGLRSIISTEWIQLYLTELNAYFDEVREVITTEHGLHTTRGQFYLNAINDAYVAYWHMGRLGLLGIGLSGLVNTHTEGAKKIVDENLLRVADTMSKMCQANPATRRPLLDVHHIEVYLVWLIFRKTGMLGHFIGWLSDLELRLWVRHPNGGNRLPFMEGRNRLDLVAEYAATGQKPYGYVDNSSYIMLMVLELCCSFPADIRDDLLGRFLNRVIGIKNDAGEKISPIHLVFWHPPENWDRLVFSGSLEDKGTAIALYDLYDANGPIEPKVSGFVSATRTQYPASLKMSVPLGPFVLACIKNRSPLPSEFWRSAIFAAAGDNDGGNTP